MTRWLTLATVLVVLDQLTKFAITRSIPYGSGIEITPFFNLVLVHNKGAAFSFLAGAAGWQRELFIAIAAVAIAWVVYLLHKHPRQTLFCFALGLILGGAIGNVIDRVWLGAVVDFLDFHAAGHHFPAFNVADSAITCGAAALIWDSFRAREPHEA
jgi:signal peptidase II